MGKVEGKLKGQKGGHLAWMWGRGSLGNEKGEEGKLKNIGKG